MDKISPCTPEHALPSDRPVKVCNSRKTKTKCQKIGSSSRYKSYRGLDFKMKSWRRSQSQRLEIRRSSLLATYRLNRKTARTAYRNSHLAAHPIVLIRQTTGHVILPTHYAPQLSSWFTFARRYLINIIATYDHVTGTGFCGRKCKSIRLLISPWCEVTAAEPAVADADSRDGRDWQIRQIPVFEILNTEKW